jgi:hypothetical protein
VKDCDIEKAKDGTAKAEATFEDPCDCPSSVREILHICDYISCVQPCDAVGPHCQQHADLNFGGHTQKKKFNPITVNSLE